VACLGGLLLWGLVHAWPVAHQVDPSLPGLSSASAQADRPESVSGEGFPSRKCIEVLDDQDAWKRLPRALQGDAQPLPAWARALAASLPRTTAAMLELDYLHRLRSPLPPVLRGRMRWVAARANCCRSSQVVALADLKRAGLGGAALRNLENGWRDAPLPERAALDFADKLTRTPPAITDEEVASLIEHYGEKQVVAMVLLVAHANFLDRIILALDLRPQAADTLALGEVQFEAPGPGAVPEVVRRPWPGSADAVSDAADEGQDEGWTAVPFEDLQQQLDRQRQRRSRIRLPSSAEENRWGLVCRTYQPELASAWAACTRAWEAEADPDPVLTGSLFQVVTHRLRNFY
jgi:alkylhydroperoxidase family enzyme